jgi:hypothetical protein
MDTTLVIVTVLSMGMAAALSLIVWRLLREEHRRSEARVVALRAAAHTPAHLPPVSAGLPASKGAAVAAVRKPAPVIAAFRPQAQSSVADAAADLPLRVPATPVPSAPALDATPLFLEPARPSPWGNRIGIMAAIALVGAAALLFALAAGRARAARSAIAAAAPAAPVEAGLELLSLRDAHQNGSLTITGMVHNPRTASLLTRVTVTAYTFDDKGAFLASGRALLDVTSLAPGDDSPFVVSVPATDAVARYRIGFRGEDGRVIGHVDRRQAGPVAAVAFNAAPQHW